MGVFFPEPRSSGHGRGDNSVDGDTTSCDEGGSKEDQGTGSGGQDNDSGGDEDDEPLEDWIKEMTNRHWCYHLAGVVGVDPKRLTLRELVWMNDAKERSDWNKFSVLVAQIHNVNCMDKKDQIDFRRIHPSYAWKYMKKSKASSAEDIAGFKMELESAFSKPK